MAFKFSDQNWDIPLLGEVDRNWIFLGAALTGSIILVIRMKYKPKNTQKNAVQPTEVYIAGQIGEDPAGNVGPIDPETGYVYGSPEDLERLGELAVEQYAEVVYYPQQYVPHHRDRDDDDGSGGGHPPPPGMTNKEWEEKALDNASSIDVEQSTMKDIVDDVFNNECITADHKEIWDKIVNKIGNPPQKYPAVHTCDTKAHPMRSM